MIFCKMAKLNLKKKIAALRNKADVLERFITCEKYFLHAKHKTKSIFYIEMKRQLYFEMQEAGLTQFECAQILNTRHNVLWKICQINSDPFVKEVVEQNKYEWLKEKVYPYSVRSRCKITDDKELNKQMNKNKKYNLCSIFSNHLKHK